MPGQAPILPRYSSHGFMRLANAREVFFHRVYSRYLLF